MNFDEMGYLNLNAHEVYSALGDGQRAADALARAAGVVRDRLLEIPDPAAREVFLTQVRVNRDIALRCKEAGLGGRPAR